MTTQHTDRELLELAAKAAGWTGWQSKHGYWNVTSPEGKDSTHCHCWNAYCPHTGEKLPESTFADAIADTGWNPLTDDGDALRLAVKLGLVVDCSRPSAGEPFKQHAIWLDELMSTAELTRRAIVRAAAEIGRSMK